MVRKAVGVRPHLFALPRPAAVLPKGAGVVTVDLFLHFELVAGTAALGFDRPAAGLEQQLVVGLVELGPVVAGVVGVGLPAG